MQKKEKKTMLSRFQQNKSKDSDILEDSISKEQLNKRLTHVCDLVLTNQIITIEKDGNKWCALLGTDLQEGVAGFGDTPKEALLKLCESL